MSGIGFSGLLSELYTIQCMPVRPHPSSARESARPTYVVLKLRTKSLPGFARGRRASALQVSSLVDLHLGWLAGWLAGFAHLRTPRCVCGCVMLILVATPPIWFGFIRRGPRAFVRSR